MSCVFFATTLIGPWQLADDGLELPGILDLAEAVAEHAGERWGLQMIVVPMKVAKQQDDWSCGHRVLAASQWVLRERAGSWPLRIEGDCLALVAPPAGAKEASDQADNEKASDQAGAKKEQETSDDDEDMAAESSQKRPLLMDDDEDDDDGVEEPAGPARKRRRKPTAKQLKQQLLDQAKSKAAEGGVTFNKNFQSVHGRNKDAAPEGHWVKFLTALGRACKSCRQLRDMIQAPAGQQIVPVPAEAEQALVVAAPYAGVGRPKGKAKGPTLESWLDRERPGVYKYVHGTVWWCRACKTECDFQRERSMSGP